MRPDEQRAPDDVPARGDDRPAPGALSELLLAMARAPPVAAGEAWDRFLRPGATVGRFELVRELGRGGFGAVWEARDRELGRAVAFKAVRADGGPGAGSERVVREAELAARLSHPNLVTLHDAGRCEHGPYLVLELLRGRTLAARLAEGPVAIAEAVRVATDVARGVAHAHAHGVVHRDLKPANVFLCDDGRVKVLDFGLAHAFGRRKADGGTPGYMAPEQRRGAPEDERTDVFALGAVLRELLAGAPPRDGGAPALDVPASPALGALVARMLDDDPVRRPRDGAEVLSGLLAAGRDLDAAPAAGSTRASVRPRPTPPASAPIPPTAPAPAPGARDVAAELWRDRRVRGIAYAVVFYVTLRLAEGAVDLAGLPSWISVAAAGLAALALRAWVRLRAGEARPAPTEARPGPASGAAGAPPAPARAAGASDPPVVAVLPLATLGAGPQDAWLGDALAEEIIHALGRIEGLRVVARTSSFAYRGAREDARRIGEALRAGYLLEGSVQRAGDRLRVSTQLVGAADGLHLWSERLDRRLSDVLALEDEVAESVARALRLVLGGGSGRAVPRDASAREHCLRAREFLRQTRRKSLEFGLAMFERAAELDAGYAPAHAGVAEAAALLHMYYPPDEARLALADRASARALALAPELAPAHAARGLFLFLAGRDDEARAALERAASLDPALFEARYYAARAAFQAGRLDDAVRLFREASSVRDDYQAAFFAAQALEAAHRAEEAREAYARALAVAERHMELNPDDPRAATMRAVALCRTGRREEGLRWAEQALSLDPQDAGVLYNVACLYALEGARDRALDALAGAVAAGFRNRAWFDRDPDLAPLRGDARFRALMDAIPG